MIILLMEKAVFKIGFEDWVGFQPVEPHTVGTPKMDWSAHIWKSVDIRENAKEGVD